VIGVSDFWAGRRFSSEHCGGVGGVLLDPRSQQDRVEVVLAPGVRPRLTFGRNEIEPFGPLLFQG
jgi:hypothetical protein